MPGKDGTSPNLASVSSPCGRPGVTASDSNFALCSNHVVRRGVSLQQAGERRKRRLQKETHCIRGLWILVFEAWATGLKRRVWGSGISGFGHWGGRAV